MVKDELAAQTVGFEASQNTATALDPERNPIQVKERNADRQGPTFLCLLNYLKVGF